MKPSIKKYFQPQTELDVIAEVDVLVVGGGPAGVSAALGAARAGADTMIVERLGSFGGMWTNGLVITLAGFNSWLRPYRRCVDGVTGEWLRRAAAL
ncbi:MAG: FAD-dependent oxidoreductase, partial [Anaerolineales bacterium]|nr:FAD-dependent oxidoreductase [Anaerolineales bacterium]